MDGLYSIGEVAEILGVTVQTLRHYNKIGLLEPAYINPETGYRYYSYMQLSLIDRIRYLQSLGLSLKEIQSAMKPGHGEMLIPFLEKQLQVKRAELQRTQDMIDALQWYINFFQYPGQQRFQNIPYKRTIAERYCLAVPIPPDEPNSTMPPPMRASLALRRLKAEPPFDSVRFLRQDGAVIDFESMLDQIWAPQNYFAYLAEKPDFQHPNVLRIPAGEYLCFQGHPLANDWDPSYIRKLFEPVPKDRRPTLVIADEYEEDLSSFTEAPYEIQILISSPNDT